MEQGFDGWVRNRFHVESSDIPDIASHIDPNLFEPDWTLPSGVDDLFGWLTSNQDVAMDQTGTYEPQAAVNATAAAGVGPPAAVSQLQAGQQAALPAPQHQVSGRQLAYLQQALQQQPQSTDMQLAMPAQQSQQQQAMFPAGAGFQAQLPAAGMAFPASPAFLQQQQQQQQLQPDIWGLQGMPYADNAQLAQAASAGAVAGTGADAAHLQHADSSGRSSPSSGSSKQQQQKSSRAPIGKGKAGGGQRKPRKVTDAQRAAHKRFRIRRKEQVCKHAWCCAVPDMCGMLCLARTCATCCSGTDMCQGVRPTVALPAPHAAGVSACMAERLGRLACNSLRVSQCTGAALAAHHASMCAT